MAVLVPGVGWDCFSNWMVKDDVAERHISQYGYDMVIAAAGAVGGSPLANIATQSQLESLKYWPGAECASGDGAPYDTFIPLSAF